MHHKHIYVIGVHLQIVSVCCTNI